MRQACTVQRFIFLVCLALLTGCVPVSAERYQPPTPAADAETQAAIAAVVAGSRPTSETFASPDGRWQAVIVVYGCTATGEETEHAYELLRMAASSAGEWRQVDSQLINCGGLGAYGLAGLCWSPDSRYFYYTPAREGVPDGTGEWSRPIWQLEAATGAIREIDNTPTSATGETTPCTFAQP